MGAGGSVNSSMVQSPDSRSPVRLSSVSNIGSRRASSKQCPIFEVSFVSAENFKFATELPSKFILRISYESLDFVNIGTLSPIIQFPFQHIICWGSGPTNFRFHLFDFERKDSKLPNAAEPKDDDDKIEDNERGNRDISIVLGTSEGAAIEENIMRIVRLLMVDIEKKAVSKEEFNALITTILNIDTGELNINWFQTVDQFSTGRTFLAKQCMDLMLLIGPLAPFEKVDLACLLYQRILTTESFQLVVNTFQDKEERENLIHRLGIKNTNVSSEFDLVTDCKILPSHVTIPSSTPTSPTKKSMTPVSPNKRASPKNNLTLSKPTTPTPSTAAANVAGAGRETAASSPSVISRLNSNSSDPKPADNRGTDANEDPSIVNNVENIPRSRPSSLKLQNPTTPISIPTSISAVNEIDSPERNTIASFDSQQTEYSTFPGQGAIRLG